MQAYTQTFAHAHACTYTQLHTYKPRKLANIQKHAHRRSRVKACARAHTHTHTHTHTHSLKRTLTHHAYGYAMGATAVHTLFSSYAHTIILLC